MFQTLSDKINQAFRHLRGVNRLSEANIEEALKEVRTALLSADVHFKVAKDFIETVKNNCLGQKVIESVTPGQQVIKIIHDELVKLLGEGTAPLSDQRPLKLMLVGLHGSGKTTTAAKLARSLSLKGYIPILIACDVYRPAAIDQLETLAKNNNILFYANRGTKDVPAIGLEGLKYGLEQGANAFIFDTAGRLQIDKDLIEEIKKLSHKVQPNETLLIADSALGQEAVNVAKHFHEAVELTGIVLTKLDGDARGGAALSMKSVTGVPIKFMGVGEKTDALEVFHPDRMAQRILGMGDVVSLVEKAQEHFDQKEAERMAARMESGEFDLNDFLNQIRQIKKMGSFTGLLKLIPGMGGLDLGDLPSQQMQSTEAIIQSMTFHERSQPNIINASRRERIAKGSGVGIKDVNALLKQFTQMQKMMKSMTKSKGKQWMKKMAGRMGQGKDTENIFGNFPPGFGN